MTSGRKIFFPWLSETHLDIRNGCLDWGIAHNETVLGIIRHT